MNAAAANSSPPGGRATSMAPDDRRAAIAAAAAPLLIEYGTALTTRQIAEAAGIAEGTIFRVFADKDAVIWAAASAAIDPEPTLRAIASIDRALPIEERMIAAVIILQSRVERIFKVMSAINALAGNAQLKQQFFEDSRRDLSTLSSIFDADAAGGTISVTPDNAALLLRAITFGASHPHFSFSEPLSAADIVSLTLDGIRHRGPHSPFPTTPSRTTPTPTR